MVQWHCCPADLCEHQSRCKHALRGRMAARRGVDARWRDCPVEGCELRAKQEGNARRHLAARHDADVNLLHRLLIKEGAVRAHHAD